MVHGFNYNIEVKSKLVDTGSSRLLKDVCIINDRVRDYIITGTNFNGGL